MYAYLRICLRGMQSSIRAVGVWLNASRLSKVPGHEAGETSLFVRGWWHGRLGAVRQRGRVLRKLRRPAWPRFLFHELTMESGDQALQRAIATISQSDPLTKLLEQVTLGRMKPADAGLRAVTDSWMGTYQKVIESCGLTRQALRRIDPNPRVAILIECGVLTGEQLSVAALRASFERAVAAATE